MFVLFDLLQLLHKSCHRVKRILINRRERISKNVSQRNKLIDENNLEYSKNRKKKNKKGLVYHHTKVQKKNISVEIGFLLSWA